MLKRDEIKVQADAIKKVAYNVNFTAGDFANSLEVVWVSKDENYNTSVTVKADYNIRSVIFGIILPADTKLVTSEESLLAAL